MTTSPFFDIPDMTDDLFSEFFNVDGFMDDPNTREMLKGNELPLPILFPGTTDASQVRLQKVLVNALFEATERDRDISGFLASMWIHGVLTERARAEYERTKKE